MRVQRVAGAVVVALTLVVVTGLLAQGAIPDRQARRSELIAVDRALSDTIVASGFAAGVAWAGAPDLVLLYPGAPVLAGRESVHQMLAAQTALTTITLGWVPLHAEVSRDGNFGVSYGVTGVAPRTGGSGPPVRFGKYLSAWRRGADGWKLVAHVAVGLLPSSVFTRDGFTVTAPAALPDSGPVAAFAGADRRFAQLAGRQGAPAAFAAFAAPDAVTFAGTGEINRGPVAIRQWLDGDDAAWSWAPVAGGGAGDLGFTVGESVITPKNGAPSYGKYLTLWRREPNGMVRYLADGGNSRPAPVK